MTGRRLVGEARGRHSKVTAIAMVDPFFANERGRTESGIPEPASPHTFCHSFATHLLEDGYDIRTVQETPRPPDVSTTMIYTHVLNRAGRGVRSPARY